MNKLNLKPYIAERVQIDPELVLAVINEWKEVHRSEFYDISTQRETFSPALKQTRAYHLRSPVISPILLTKTESTRDIMEMIDTALYSKFPVLKHYIDEVGKTYGGWKKLGRVFVTKLSPESKIGRHIDEGKYFDELHRHHFVLDSAGSIFHWDKSNIEMVTGETWKLNNSIPHWVENNTVHSRTHIIFDGT